MAKTEKTIWIARPDDAKAQAAAQNNVSIADGLIVLWLIMILSVSCSSATILQTARENLAVALGTGAAWGCLLTVVVLATAHAWYRRRKFKQYIAHGRIIAGHPEFIKIWNELRLEKDLRLSSDEYDRFLPELFGAAKSTAKQVQELRNHKSDPQGADAATWVTARIRLHMLPALEQIRRRLLLEAQMQTRPNSAFDVTDDMIVAEFERLKSRANESANPKGD